MAGEDAAASLAASDKFGNTFSLASFLQVRALQNWWAIQAQFAVPGWVQTSALLGGTDTGSLPLSLLPAQAQPSHTRGLSLSGCQSRPCLLPQPRTAWKPGMRHLKEVSDLRPRGSRFPLQHMHHPAETGQTGPDLADVPSRIAFTLLQSSSLSSSFAHCSSLSPRMHAPRLSNGPAQPGVQPDTGPLRPQAAGSPQAAGDYQMSCLLSPSRCTVCLFTHSLKCWP